MKALMRKTIVLMVLLSLCGCAGNSRAKKLVGSPAPYAHMTMFDGSIQVLDQAKGKVAVVAFWSSWCNNSRPVVEELNEFAKTARNRHKFVVYAVSLDKSEDYEALKEKIVYRKLDSVQHVFSGNEGYDELFMAFHGDTFPLVIVIDQKGVVRAVGEDAETALAILRTL
ncbi:MAG: TlpA disulfide reductase family protein [Bdellovibrionota bacterium]|nr:MAG: TlpA disulfide reductase family protein [Bdellovibrionota bacterium]